MRSAGVALSKFLQGYVSENSNNLTNNEIINFIPMLTSWQQGKYNIGDIVKYNNYAYRCVQAHDSTDNASWNPIQAQSLWANYHATDDKHALYYIQPSGAHDAYMKGECVIWNHSDGYIRYYKSIVDNLIYDPETYPQGWKEIID